MKPTYDELLEMLDNVSAAADNMLHRYAPNMSSDDFDGREKVVRSARATCDSLLRSGDERD